MWAKHSWQLELWKELLWIEVRGIEQDLIPYVGQLELANVPTEGWIIDPNIHSLLDGSYNVMYLPPTMEMLSTLVG